MGAYLYGLEATGQKDCEYMAVAVGLDGTGVEDAPAVVCVSAGAAVGNGVAKAKLTTLLQLSRAVWLPASGPWPSHVWDAKSSTYHVLAYMDEVYQRDVPSSNKSQSVVVSVDINAKKNILSYFSPDNCEWNEHYPGKIAPRNPIVGLAGVADDGTLHAIAARTYELRSYPDHSAIGRRMDLAFVKLTLSSSSPSVQYLFNITKVKAGDPSSIWTGFLVESGDSQYHAMLYDDGAPETGDEKTVMLKLDAKARKEDGRWSYTIDSYRPRVFDVAAPLKSKQAQVPVFPDSFSAVRVILESPRAHAPVQYGWEKRDFTKGLHATARSMDNQTTDETFSDSKKQAGWTVWRDYKTKAETSCKSFTYMDPTAQKYLANATFVKNAPCPPLFGPTPSDATSMACDFWSGIHTNSAGDHQVTVAVLGTDHTQLVRMDFLGGGLSFHYPIKDWKAGESLELPSDCPTQQAHLIV